MKKHAIRLVFSLGLAAILGVLCFQVYWIISNYKNKQEEVLQKINIVLYRVAEGLADYNQISLDYENLITRQSNNYYIVNINTTIDANVLEHYMLDEMNKARLLMDFEYAIYDCEEDQMVYGHYCNIDDLPEASTGTSLPKYDRFEYYFGVRFPQIRSTVMGDMTLTFILSGLLMITLMFFGVALYVILSQRRLSRLQRDFINNMTHELKTPLSAIKIAGDTFLHDDVVKTDSRLIKYAGIVSDQAGRLNQQVEKILDIARLEGDLVQLKKEAFDLVPIVHSIIDDYNQKIKQDNHQIKADIRIGHALIFGDPLHTTNVIHNLVDNALKYGGGDSGVEVLLGLSDRSCVLDVRDSGPGIPKKEHSRIFEKFYRIPTGDVHDHKGFGLGLYYVSQIVRLHGWNLDLDSEEGSHSSFRITIPVLKQ